MSYIPSVTFQKYLKDGVETDISSLVTTIASGTFSGIDEDKYIYSIVIDPMELTTETVSSHQLVFNISPNLGDEGKYMKPMTWHPLSGSMDNFRVMEVIDQAVTEYAWADGLTSGVMDIDIDSGFEGSGTEAFITPDSGTAWSPPFGTSGTQVMDVPTIYQGSFVNVIDPSTWDGVDRLHDFQLVQVHTGHAVKVADWSNIESGTFVDNEMELWYDNTGTINLDVMTYHEFPAEWELALSGVVQQSGVQTYSLNEWLLIDNLDLGSPTSNVTYTLNLFWKWCCLTSDTLKKYSYKYSSRITI